MNDRPRGFTIIELLAALVLLAVLTSTVTLSFQAPLRRQQTQDALAAIRQFDADARAAAVAGNTPIRIVFDLSSNSLSRQTDGHEQFRIHLNSALRQVDLDGSSTSAGEVEMEISPTGWSPSYAVAVTDQWIAIAGLSGETKVQSAEPVE